MPLLFSRWLICLCSDRIQGKRDASKQERRNLNMKLQKEQQLSSSLFFYLFLISNVGVWDLALYDDLIVSVQFN
jgi:hypothetical protein